MPERSMSGQFTLKTVNVAVWVVATVTPSTMTTPMAIRAAMPPADMPVPDMPDATDPTVLLNWVSCAGNVSALVSVILDI
jgi:hypothetical protein